MEARGALERTSEGVFALRFENFLHENRARIRIRQGQWGWEVGWPSTAGCPPTIAAPPSLLLSSLSEAMQQGLHIALLAGDIVGRPQDGDLLIDEADYLPFLKASCEGPFLPLADFQRDQCLYHALLADHAASPTLLVRNGVLCVPWTAVVPYTPPGASPLAWELDPQDIPVCGPI
jgi:hypothetical protein